MQSESDVILGAISQNQRIQLIAPLGYGINTSLSSYFLSLGMKVSLAVSTSDLADSLVSYLKSTTNSNDIYRSVKNRNTPEIIILTYKELFNQIVDKINDGYVGTIDFCQILIIQDVYTNSNEYSYLKLSLNLWEYFRQHGKDIIIPRLIELTTMPIDNPRIASVRVTSGQSNEYFQSEYLEVVVNNKPHELPNPKSIAFQTVMLQKIMTVISNPYPGNILVYMWNNDSVEQLVDRLQKENPKDDVVYIAAGKKLSEEKLAEIHNPSEKRKVLITTEEISHSIVSRDFTILIDSMKEVRNRETESGSYYPDVLTITKDRANVRGSRIGSVACHRIMSQKAFDNLPGIQSPSINEPITSQVLKLLEKGISNSDIQELLLDPKTGKELNIIERLELRKILSEPKWIGLFNDLPNSTMIKVLIIKWLQEQKSYDDFRKTYPIAVLAGLIDAYEYTYFDFRDYKSDKRTDKLGKPEAVNKRKDESNHKYEHIKAYYNRFRGRSDVETLINIWNAFITEVRNDDGIRNWTIRNAINYNRWIKAINMINLTTDVLKYNHYPVDREVIDTQILMGSLKPIMKDVYKDEIYRVINDSGKYFYKKANNIDSINYYLDRFGIINTYRNDHPTYLVGIITSHIKSTGGSGNSILLLTLDVV